MTRRAFLRGSAAFVAGSFALGSYAFGVEPLLRLVVTRYQFTPAGWPPGLRLRICALADIHAVNPGMPVERIAKIVAAANGMKPDIVLLLGDYSRGRTRGWSIPPADWARELGRLRAPLGAHAILGNHDWWEDKQAQLTGHGPTQNGAALEAVGIPVYQNTCVRLVKDGKPFWLAGLGDQIALLPNRQAGREYRQSLADLPATLAKCDGEGPVLLMAHEPDIFPHVPARVSLTLSGHTHGGQVRMLGYSPVVPSRYGNRYAYGHINEDGRDLIVSGGLGCSVIPVRFGMPPEIVMIELGGPKAVA